MNIPMPRSALLPPCRRPISTVPNTTSSWPHSCDSTRAQAVWNNTPGLTPSARAALRTRPESVLSSGSDISPVRPPLS